MAALTEKQKRFCDLYIKLGNATEAAIQAGYSRKTAKVIGQENLTKPYLREYINDRLAELESSRIADAKEVLQYLTAVMRGEKDEEVIVTEGVGDGRSEAKIVKKKMGGRDQVRAAELLAKRYGLLTDKVEHSGSIDTGSAALTSILQQLQAGGDPDPEEGAPPGDSG